MYTIYCILYTIYCTLYTVYCIVYPVYFKLLKIYCILYIVYFILFTFYYLLYNVCSILYTVTVYCIVPAKPNVLYSRGRFVDMVCRTITKPPLFQRNRLTGSGNPTFESYVEGKAREREIEVYSRSSL